VGSLPERQVLAGHPQSIPCVTFSPDGRRLASGSKEGTVRLWDTATNSLARTISLAWPVQTVAFSPDGRMLATGTWGNLGEANLKLWDAETGRLVATPLPPKPLGLIFQVAFSGDGSLLAAVGNGLAVWRITQPPADDTTEGHIELVPAGSAAGNRSLSMSVGADARTVALINNDRDVQLWDIAQNRLLDIGAPHVLHGWHNLWAHPDGRHLFFVDQDGAVVAWDVTSRRMDWRFEGMPRCQSFHCALSSDGRWLAVDGEPTAAAICDVTTRRRLFQLRAERAPIWCLAWSPDNRRLALGLSDGGLSIWDLEAVRSELSQLGLDWQSPAIPRE
jgi:WD40 repeat protein